VVDVVVVGVLFVVVLWLLCCGCCVVIDVCVPGAMQKRASCLDRRGATIALCAITVSRCGSVCVLVFVHVNIL